MLNNSYKYVVAGIIADANPQPPMWVLYVPQRLMGKSVLHSELARSNIFLSTARVSNVGLHEASGVECGMCILVEFSTTGGSRQ